MIYFCVSTVRADDAADLARTLVEERLAACVNIVPGVRSFYRWKGEICDESEVVLLIKTAPVSMGGFEERFKELHPYDCPELLILPIEEGFKEYFYWVQEMTGPQDVSMKRRANDANRDSAR
ncbi:MAG: divalent-cation tolerance protein CutA [Planctomycetes bacterium]|nr:divalent-cation tolerance protein CutA [Planctomycetota bacterium]